MRQSITKLSKITGLTILLCAGESRADTGNASPKDATIQTSASSNTTTSRALELSAGISQQFASETTLRYLGTGDKAWGFAIDAVGNAYRHPFPVAEEFVKKYLEDLPVNANYWTPTGALVNEVGDTTLLSKGRTVQMYKLVGGKNQAGFVYTTTGGSTKSTLFCTVFGGSDRWGEECQIFRGVHTGDIAIARQSGDVYFSNSEGIFRSSPYNFASTRVRIGDAAQELYAGANTVYKKDLYTSSIWKHEPSGWSLVSGPVDDFAVSIDGIRFKTVGSIIYQHFGGSLGWQQIGEIQANGKLALAVGRSSDVYVYDNDGGRIYRYGGFPNQWDFFYGPIAKNVVASQNEILFTTGRPAAESSLLSITHPRETRNPDDNLYNDASPAPLSGPWALLAIGFGFLGLAWRRSA